LTQINFANIENNFLISIKIIDDINYRVKKVNVFSHEVVAKEIQITYCYLEVNLF